MEKLQKQQELDIEKEREMFAMQKERMRLLQTMAASWEYSRT